MMASTLADNSSRTLPASGRKREQEIRLFASTRRYDCKRLHLVVVALWVSRYPIETGIRSRLRSEEHTSELQSLMRISYAVFCLKKKKTSKYKQQIQQDEIEEQSRTN